MLSLVGLVFLSIMISSLANADKSTVPNELDVSVVDVRVSFPSLVGDTGGTATSNKALINTLQKTSPSSEILKC